MGIWRHVEVLSMVPCLREKLKRTGDRPSGYNLATQFAFGDDDTFAERGGAQRKSMYKPANLTVRPPQRSPRGSIECSFTPP